VTDRWFGNAGSWSFSDCRSCGIVWLDPAPKVDDIPALYDGYYTHSSGDEPPLAPPRSGTTKRLLARLMPWRRHAYLASLSHLEDLQPGRLLEIGCGSGAFLRSAEAAGWKVVGLDFDERAVQGCVASGLDVRAGDVLTEQLDAGSFDAVVMNNVLEHLYQPVETVSKIHSLLRKGGRLVSVTPNPRSLGHRIHGGAWRGLEPPRHLNLFSPPALKRMAASAGFSSAQAFSSAGGLAGRHVLIDSGASSLPPGAVLRAEQLLIMAGVQVGEWSVLVAHR
jgi:SAM-dependent methyltransferase